MITEFGGDSVLFTDESRFNLFRADGRRRVYHRRNEQYADLCYREGPIWRW
jgi:hypothetical protein